MTFSKTYRVLLLFVLWTGLSWGQEFWQGQLQAKRLLLEKSRVSSTIDSFFISSPEYYYKRLPLEAYREHDSLFLENKQFNITINLPDVPDSSFTALLTNYNGKNLVYFRQVNGLQPHTYPQHPRGVLPYKSTDMVFTGKETGIEYGGTLVIPEHKKHYPLALLLNGTGQHDRNYTYSGHQFFTVLADALAREGIASFRMDDRGVGNTTGDFQTSALSDFTADAGEALNYLKSAPNVDRGFIGVIGHSEGGVVASEITADRADVKFMVSLSGVGVTGLKILDLQNTAVLKSYKLPDSIVNLQMDLYRNLFETVYRNRQPDSLESQLQQQVSNWMQDKSTETLKAINLADGRDQTLLYRFYNSAKSKAYKEMILYDPKQYLTRIQAPVLVLNGAADIFVPAFENVNSFKKYLTHAAVLDTKIYPGLNHMYQHCTTCNSEEMNTLEEVFAPEVIDDIASWILMQYHKVTTEN